MIYTDTSAACDCCGIEHGSASSIKETRALLKEKGWVRRKNKAGVWEDLCDVCKLLKEKPVETPDEDNELEDCVGCTKPTCFNCMKTKNE